MRTEIKVGTLLILNENKYALVFLPMVVQYEGARESGNKDYRKLTHTVGDVRYTHRFSYNSLEDLRQDYTPIEEIAQRK